MPTVDERIAAIAQQVELLGEMQLKTEKVVQRTARGLNTLRKYALMIAADHEARIGALEAAAGDEDET